MTSLQLYNTDSEKKKQLLGVDELSEVEKRYSYNALVIFKERYLLKDNEGKTVERLDDLFKRVAVASGLMEVLYLHFIYNKDGKPDNKLIWDYLPSLKAYENNLQNDIKDLDYKDINTHPLSFKLGQFTVNPFHIQALFSRYSELFEEGKINVGFDNILFMLKEYKSDIFRKHCLSAIEKYYDLMADNIFLPNTPTLMNAGTKIGMLSACFVQDVDDTMESWGDFANSIMLISKSGGGVGCNYSKIRPDGDIVKSTGGIASGPVSYMSIIDNIANVVKGGGKRRAALMAELNIWHPEVIKFIKAKDNEKRQFENFNMSLCVDDKFFECFFNNKNYDLHFNDKIYDSINAKDLMEMITNNVYNVGDPGMVFYDTMNKDNLLIPIFNRWVDSTNPCGEQILYPNDSCNLGSINLAKFVKDGKFDVIEFMNTCNLCTQFLDGVIDANKYPLPRINEMTKNCRRIGLGFMGLADLFNQLGIQYNSDIGFTLAEYISAIMTGQSLKTSSFIAGFKGAFPYYYDEKYKDNREKLPLLATEKEFKSLEERSQLIKEYLSQDINIKELYSSIPLSDFGLRNCNVTTIAPTGTLSMFVDCSSGIEPTYSHGFKKKVTVGEFYYVNKYLEEKLKELDLYSTEILEEIIGKNGGTLANVDVIPQNIKDIFVTAMDIHPFDHLAIQGLCQRWISNSISKTINAPNNISQKQIEHCYVLSHQFGCRGTTIYRDGSKHTQVLNNSNFNSHRMLKVSDFTLYWIESLDIPQQYKEEIINYISSHEQIDPTNIKEIKCSKCNTDNSIISNGATCSMCKSCGELIGCSSS